MNDNKRFYRDFDGSGGTIIRDRQNDDANVFEFGIDDSKSLCGLLNEFAMVEEDKDYACALLKRTIDELKYFIKPYNDDEIDITVRTLIKNVDLFLGDIKDNLTG